MLSAFSTNAQISMPIDGVNIQTNIDYPKPGQKVEVSLESFNVDLNSSSIVWIVGGKIQTQGVGLTKTTITTPSIGSKLEVRADVKMANGREVKKIITIQSSSVDMIWEAGGYAPPFYKGKVPFSYQNTLKVIAIPHLSDNSKNEIDPKNLVYSWKLGGKYIDGLEGKGYGMQSIVIPADDLPRNLDITVDVTNKEQTLHTASAMTINPDKPSIAFYEEDSLYGTMFNKLLAGNVALNNTEMKVLAVPFGFNILNKDISYIWSINNMEQKDLLENRSITIRTKGDRDGNSNINLQIINQDDILQGADAGFTVYFSKAKSNSDISF